MSVLVDRGPVWVVTLDRPMRANTLSSALVESLHATLDQVEAAEPDGLVLQGNPRHFAAGFDLGGLDRESDASLALRFLRIGTLLERIIALPIPTVAVAEGAAVGAGADLVLACDHRLVDPSVTLRFPGSAFGVALGTVRRAEVGDAQVTGTPADLPQVLADLAIGAPATAHPPHDADRELGALARSVSVPGLHRRLTAYAAQTRKKEPA